MHRINDTLSQLKNQIHNAAASAGRFADDITLLGVSKKQSDEKLIAAAKLGLKDFGENYLQEALKHQELLKNFDICWHFIGPIQSNKCKSIAENFAWVHSVDRLKIAERLSALRPETLPALNICLQVNLDNEAGKAGAKSSEIETLCAAVKKLPNINLRGLMLIPAPRKDIAQQHQVFSKTRLLLEQLNQQQQLRMDSLSMGMSADLDAAIAEGSTIVRIGSALFGART